ncbi:MAG: alpha/beta fold hydrolase [bacterium]|nr:alpha/beta fold hydrolase [bacterium]MDZ4284911.1 alpha/beta fold hydrolase [Patescibacteria group bacterium]
MEHVTLKTTDGVVIAGFYQAGTSRRGALLLHMMPATKESWDTFAAALHERGYHTLAVDLRGHGESDGGPDGYQKFDDARHRSSTYDVEAGVLFLVDHGIAPEGLVVIGASIGANLAIEYLAAHSEVRQAVALSAGLNYHGVSAEHAIEMLRAPQRVFLVSAEDDRVLGNAEMNRRLAELVPEAIEKKLLIYTRAGHGTDMFGKEEPDLAAEILAWLR